MSRKMTINRLEKEELIYELKIRGVAVGSVEEMRPRLALALQLEKSGDSLRYPDYPFKFTEDAEAVSKTLSEITTMVVDFQGVKNSGESLKLQTKVAHVLGRLDHMEPKDDTQENTKSNLVAQALTLMGEYKQKIEDAERLLGQIPPSLAQLQSRVTAQSFNANVHQAAHSSPIAIQPPPSSTTALSNTKMIPPHKWNIKKFTGNTKDISLTAFFEMVEEHRIARNVPENILLDAGMDLFAEKAYQFYKDCRSRVNSWGELVAEFREEYLSANHMDALFEELQRRTQHPSESIGVYLAVMSSYFNRLRCPVSEDVMMAIVMKNLHPFYQDRFRDPLPTSISELRTVCRRMESRRDVINSYVEPSSRRAHVIEKDLAFVEVTNDLCALNVTTTGTTSSTKPPHQVICFRCKQPGHRAIGCALPSKIHCYGCNREGFTKKTCPTCSNKGNGHGHS